ncbi:MAG: response regulator [Bacteroidales bacterium]
MKILYVEDNKTDSALTQRQLLKDMPDAVLLIAPTLKDARDHLQQDSKFGLLLLDMNLPDGIGLDLLVEVRKKELPLTVIFLAGSGDEESAVAALKAGADDYIVKKHGYLDTLAKTIEIALLNRKAADNTLKQTLNVLYSEHNSADIEFTVKHLSQYAPYIKLTVCYTAREVLQQLEPCSPDSCSYDVLLTDYRLTGMSGLELIKTVKQVKRLPIAIIMVTGQGDEEIAIQALKLGADEYLVKRPNYLYRLPSMILSACQRHELQKQQAALRQSEERFRRLAENAPDIIFRYEIKPVNRFSYVSPVVTKITGYTPEEHYADPDLGNKLIHPDDRGLLLKAAVETNEPLVLRWVRKDGTVICTELRIVPVYDEEGTLIALEGIARDISVQKEIENALKENEKKYRLLADNSGDVIFVLDLNLRYTFVSPAVEELRGYTVEEVMSQSLEDVLTPESYRLAMTIINEELKPLILSGGNPLNTRVLELEMKRKDGTTVPTEVKVSVMSDGDSKPVGLVGVTRDITGRKIIESELIRAKEKAEESDRLKTAFLANMSHEIRTPMNGILGFTQILRRSGTDDKNYVHYLDIINSSCDRLLAVVNDIIEISKIEAGIIEINKDDTDIGKVIQEVADFYSGACQNKNLTLTWTMDIPEDKVLCNTDDARLHQILSNLISNAVKFTVKGGIAINCTFSNNLYKFTVTDTGVGIEEKSMKVVFERFRQADENLTRQYGGSGLGLAIAKAYTEALGGEIWLESETGKGSKVSFTLPFDQSKKISKQLVEEADIDNINWNGKKILVAEDETDSYLFVAEVLEPTGITIFHASNGKEALEIYNRSLPDIVLLDIRMPKLDGYQVIKEIRKHNTEIPVIAITAYALETDRQKALLQGFNDHITKPVRYEHLLRILQKHLG